MEAQGVAAGAQGLSTRSPSTDNDAAGAPVAPAALPGARDRLDHGGRPPRHGTRRASTLIIGLLEAGFCADIEVPVDDGRRGPPDGRGTPQTRTTDRRPPGRSCSSCHRSPLPVVRGRRPKGAPGQTAPKGSSRMHPNPYGATQPARIARDRTAQAGDAARREAASATNGGGNNVEGRGNRTRGRGRR